MFYDLNLPMLRSSVDRERTVLLGQLFEYGYDCVALNTVIYGRLPKQHRCKGERIKFDAGAVRPVPGRQRKFRDPSLLRGGGLSVGPTTLPPGHGATLDTGPDQVTRLTVVLESSADAQLLNAGSDALQTYDVVAAVPCCQRSFELLSKDSDVDIISLPSGNRLPFTLNKKLTDAALARGAVFEITYTQALQSSSARRYLIGNTRSLVRLTRGRGIILSSGAESAHNTRSPHDVANLGQLLGLTQEQSLRAVSDTPLAVLRRAEARKYRFRGLDMAGAADSSAQLESFQIPKEFYLPEAMPAVGMPKRGGESRPRDETPPGEGEEDAEDESSQDEGGFLSFSAGGMDVNA